MLSFTCLLVCLLHGHWHVTKNNAAPFLKDVRLDADCKTAGRELKVSAAWYRGELSIREEIVVGSWKTGGFLVLCMWLGLGGM